jgi:pyruvate formate lyase activating enzyme
MEKNYREAMLYRKYADEKVECRLCSHYCKISQGESGICKVRRNIDGRLYSLNWGAADGAAIDPVEKNRFTTLNPAANPFFRQLWLQLYLFKLPEQQPFSAR